MTEKLNVLKGKGEGTGEGDRDIYQTDVNSEWEGVLCS